LLEWAEVHGNLYGTPRARVEDELARGRDVLFDIDWQGARQLAAGAAADIVRIFILPPSGQALAERLEKRAKDAPEVVARRLAGAPREIEHWSDYDYVIVNGDLEESFRGLVAIVAAERLKRSRQTGLALLAKSIIADLGKLRA
ncbi:MAG TPA: guanylate kinase, partial [Hyphomicrobiaceae bacterium]|nr:guanylate kinase [Hyphomicrobiaceae bacterium]